ncbi:hypothetical protein J4482_03190 [Candidatus Woesearchaeota archaeon]|nr:hypothetical protein [Candidatus Woesearchaeota archaeon]
MDKKGQITVFIVVGIIILFVVGFALYISGIQPGLRVFTEKESELQQYIGFCLEDVSQQAIVLIGNTGGYLEVPENIRINEQSYFSFSTRGEPKIPLWYYRGQPRIPTKESISTQISDYVTQNVNSCLKNFESFKDRFNFRMVGNISAETMINENDVFVKLNYPVESENKITGERTRNEFVARNIGVKLGKIYSMAADILESETRKTFFENLTMELLSASADRFPFTGMEFSCKPHTWKKSDMIDIAKSAVYYNIQQVTVAGNSVKLFDAGNIYSANHLVFPLSKTYSDIVAAFFYPRESRFELHVRPNDQPLLRSNMGRSQEKLLGFFCINTWHFTYDIEYSVLSTLRDAAAFNGDGFSFNFAFPVTINHNAGDKREFTPSQFESPDVDYDFCTTTNDRTVDIRAKDATTYEELYGAVVEYKCVRFLCGLGNTTSDMGAYRLRTKIPSACTNGELSALLDGYMHGKTVYEGTDYAEILMMPVKKFKVNFNKYDSDNFNRVEQLPKGDSVVVVITSLSDPDFEQVYSTESSEDVSEIELINWDHTYHIEAFLIQDGQRVIGGYVGDWNVKYPDIAGKSTVTFNLVQKIPIAVSEEEQANAALYLSDDKSYQEQLKPTFS